MKNTKNTIVINGKTYDSRTGQPVGTASRRQITVSDMVVKPLPPAVKLPVTPVKKLVPLNKSKPNNAHPAPKTAKRSLQHSQTLMRHAVKKPHTKSASRQVHVTQPAEASAAAITVSRRALVSPKQADHLAHAKTIQKSSLISKFGSSSPLPKTFTKRTAPVAVAPHPPREPHVPAVPPPASHSHSQTEVLFTKALRDATAHTQPAHKVHKTKTRHRSLRRMARSTIAGALTVAIVTAAGVAFTLNQQERNEFKRAARAAGIAATLPANLPSGYERPIVQSAPGEVTLRYASNSDGRSFTISQQATAPTSGEATLGFDTTGSTIEADNGVSIYRTGNLALWTKEGIRYTVSNANNLSNDQLRALAKTD